MGNRFSGSRMASLSKGGGGSGGGSGALELISNYDFAADGTSHTFAGLDGNTDEVYVLKFRLIKAVVANIKVVVNPNGITTNQVTKGTVDGSGTGSISSTTLQILENGGASVDDVDTGVLWLDAKTGFYRTGRLNSLEAASGGGGTYVIDSALTWQETVTNITSLDVVCDQANGIKAGSYLRLYKLKKV